LLLLYNNNMTNETNEKYSWDPEKRERNIRDRGLDIVRLADGVFGDPNVALEVDPKPNDDNEVRFLAFGLVDGERLCLCYTPREDKLHLITIFKLRERTWRKHYGKN